MLRKRLLRVVLNISYYNSLVVGLLPAPLDHRTQKFRFTRLYLTHSAFVHLFCLVVSAYACRYYYNVGYMTMHSVLQWTYSVTNLTKNLFMCVLVKEVWSKRQCVIEAYVDYCTLEGRHKAFIYGNKCSAKEENVTELSLERETETTSSSNVVSDCETGKEEEAQSKALKHRTADLIICKFLLAHSVAIMNVYNFLSQHSGSDFVYLLITYMSFALNVFLISISGHFFFVFCQLYRQFADINWQLRAQLDELRLQGSLIAAAEAFALRINYLATLHLDGYRLAQRIFSIGELTLAALLLRLFAANLRTVYSACLFLSQNMTENLWSLANELLYTVAYFGDTAMVMGMLNSALRECNATGQVLREFAELVEMHDTFCLKRALDSFSAHLSSHKLRYKVCGLFEFNKEASLQFFLMVLVKVTVLVQFDMQNRLRE